MASNSYKASTYLDPEESFLILLCGIRKVLDALLDAVEHLIEHKGVICQQLPPQHPPQAIHIELPLLSLSEQLQRNWCLQLLFGMPWEPAQKVMHKMQLDFCRPR